MAEPYFDLQPVPAHPGWYSWNLTDPTCFNGAVMGAMMVRAEGAVSARLRMMPAQHHANMHAAVHGGVTLALADVSLFAAARMVGGAGVDGAVTLDLAAHFISPGRIGEPLDAVAEVLRETGRMVFLRGLIEQDGTLVASFSGALRKPSRR